MSNHFDRIYSKLILVYSESDIKNEIKGTELFLLRLKWKHMYWMFKYNTTDLCFTMLFIKKYKTTIRY